MANLRAWILNEADGESIEAVVIGKMGWGDYGKEAVPGYEEHPRNTVLSWDEAQPFLTYEFNCGYGAPGCEAIYAWTASKVIAISQYDGSTDVYSLPRFPTVCTPIMVGG